MKVRYHINPETGRPNICRATIKCLYADAEGNEPPHWESKAEARRYYELKQGTLADPRKFSLVEKVPYAAKIASVKDDALKKLENRKTDYRASRYMVMKEEVARKRLAAAINHEAARDNYAMVNMLSEAQVVASGTFEVNNQTISVDKVVSQGEVGRLINEQRGKLNDVISAYANENDLKVGSSFSAVTPAGTKVNGKVTEKLDNDYYNSLPDDVKEKISVTTSSYSVDNIDSIPKDLQDKIMVTTYPSHFIAVNPSDLGVREVRANTKLEGDTPEEKISSGLSSMGALYDEHRELTGQKMSQRTADERENKKLVLGFVKTTIDPTAAARGEEVKLERPYLVPGSKRNNGIVITSRQTINSSAAEKYLSYDQRMSLMKPRTAPDMEKAKEHLSPEQFRKLYPKGIAVRVYEPK